ncbi:MAG: hypothetical protein WC548_01155 [Candidatus Pacearchaeota archaeon]
MKDIVLNTSFKKFQYYISWFGFIVFGMIIAWVIALFLANYGKNTSNDVKKNKNVLNKSWQKFVFVYGLIFGNLFLVLLIVDIMLLLLTGNTL